MGEGSDRVRTAGDPAHVGAVSGEIETLRGELGDLVAELDRRRHEALDLRLQLRRHPMAAAVAATGAALLVGGAVAYAVHRRRQRQELSTRARELRRAVRAIVHDPYHVAKDTSLTRKLVAAAGTTLVTLLARRLFERFVPPPEQVRPPRTAPVRSIRTTPGAARP